MYTDQDGPPKPPQEDLIPDEVKYSDLKISHVEHLSIINYLTKAIEDALIRKVSFLKYPLLLIDIPLLMAVLIVNVERMLYTNIVDYILAHIKYDIRIITKTFQKIVPMAKKTGEYEEEEEEVYEESTSGKAFQWFRNFIRFLWGLIILGMVLPLWPLIILYNIFIETVIIGVLYYFLIFGTFTGWWGMLLYFFVFCTVTFIIASISVPRLLKAFIYLKHLFSLERKSWKEISNEAKYAFFQFYLRIQKNRQNLLEQFEPQYQKEHKVQGGIYYLMLKTVYWIKDKFWGLRKRNVAELFHKVEKKMQQLTSDLAEEKEEYEKSVSAMKPAELFKTTIALILTFLLSILLVSRGTHGQGVIGAILISFYEYGKSLTTWINFSDSGLGYYEFLAQSSSFVPGLIRLLAHGIDQFFHYFFQAYYYILPLYVQFIQAYYSFYFGKFISSIFY